MHVFRKEGRMQGDLALEIVEEKHGIGSDIEEGVRVCF